MLRKQEIRISLLHSIAFFINKALLPRPRVSQFYIRPTRYSVGKSSSLKTIPSELRVIHGWALAVDFLPPTETEDWANAASG